jgi:hypothetical protein
MKVLYLTDSFPDYLSDDLLYGLRSVLGPDVVDYPRKDVLYDNSPWRAEAHRLYGRGFHCFGLAEQPVDRTDLPAKIAGGHFDAIINSSAHRIRCPLHPRLAVIDCEDHEKLTYRYHRRVAVYFKRELPAPRSGVEPILFALPDFLNDQSAPPRVKRMHASFGPTSEMRRQLADKYPPEYTFTTWTDYRNDIRQSWFALSPKGVGYDCQRHYEILGQAVLCIHLDAGAPFALRKFFVDGENCLVFSSTAELERKVDQCREPGKLIARAGEDLRRFHLASRRGEQLLEALERHLPARRTPGWLGRRAWDRWMEQAPALHTRALDS